ncbi:MAG: membrane protein insertase YidC [Thermoanaerobaculia bacterium]
MDGKRLLFAAAASFLVLMLWEWLGPKPAPRPATPPAPAAQAQAAPPVVAPPAAAPEQSVAAAAETSTVLENEVLRATFSNRGAVMTSLVLRHHADDEGRPLELIPTMPRDAPRPLAVLLPGDGSLSRRARNALFVAEKTGERGVRFRYADSGLAVTKEIRLSGPYLFDLRIDVPGQTFTVLAGVGLRNRTETRGTAYALPLTAIATVGNGFERVKLPDAKGLATWPMPDGGFAGLEDSYFLAVILPKAPERAMAQPLTLRDSAGKTVPTIVGGVTAKETLAAQAYYGPKDVEILDALELGLERTVDFGWFEILARPLLWLLKWTYSWAGNYGLAILFVTLIVRILIFPLMHKSYASMRKMQKLAPKMTAIRDKYKKSRTDAAQRAKMNQELMALYQAEGYNPMSGCFPMLLQLPILIAFFNVLSRSIELRHAPFVLWIKDLSAPDRTYVLVIIMIVTMYVQQAMTPSAADPIQKRIFMAMPIIWGFFLKDMPSGLVLYWLFSNVLTILQQLLINRMGSKDEPKVEKPPGVKKARVPRSA